MMPNYKVCIGMFGVQDLCGGDPRKVLEVAKLADEAGIHQLNFTDHVIMGENTGKYPFGDFPVPFEYPWYEPMVLMSAVAGITRRVRVATGVLIAPLRPAALLAKMAATLDVLSDGRLDLGIGIGWQREEYEACGIPFEGRMARLDDQVRAMHILWQQVPADFASPTVSFQRLYSKPFPVQEGGVPLWYGVKATEENAARIAELGNGWVPIQSRPDFIAPGVEMIRKAFREAGRDPASLRVRAVVPPALDDNGKPCLDKVAEVAGPLLDAGATHLEFMPYMYVQNYEGFQPFFEKLVSLS